MSNLRFDKAFFKDLYRLVKPYWVSEEKISAWGLLALNILCVIGEVRASVGYNHFHKIFYNALQNLDKVAIVGALFYLLKVCVFLGASLAGYIYFNGLLCIRWRRWLTKNYIEKWLANHNHYRMQTSYTPLDNPDQRISEDLEQFPTMTLSLFLGPYKLLHSILIIFTFGYILWGLSPYFIFKIGSWQGYIPGYVCWVALLYATLGTGIILWIGKKLAKLDYQQQHYSADFRFSLVRLRESSEQVSLYRGESNEQLKFQGLFERIKRNFLSLLNLKTRLAVFQKAYGYFSYVIGFIVSLPFFLAKAFPLGTVMQISSAYNSVIGAFSTFIELFKEIAEWRSIVQRLAEFTLAIDKLNQSSTQISIQHHSSNILRVENLSLNLPNNKPLLSHINLTLHPGQRLLIMGPTGVGKSTFLRALAGLWFYGEGKIFLPEKAKLLFLPQKPYLPLGTLKDLLLYPNTSEHEDVGAVLKYVSLEKFKLQLNETKNWHHELSIGEQQLVAFARVFLFKPDIIFLDEATSALDEATENRIYHHLKELLPNTIVISVGHRSSLLQFHEETIHLGKLVEKSVEIEIL